MIEDVIPAEFYSQQDAIQAIAMAQAVIDAVSKLLVSETKDKNQEDGEL